MNIAIFWKIHHELFQSVRKADQKVLWYNIGWLLFIILLPFTTLPVSFYVTDTPAVYIYSLNTFFVTYFKITSGITWLYVPNICGKKSARSRIDYRLACNVAMINSALACLLSFVDPLPAFLIHFIRLPMIWVARLIFKPRLR